MKKFTARHLAATIVEAISATIDLWDKHKGENREAWVSVVGGLLDGQRQSFVLFRFLAPGSKMGEIEFVKVTGGRAEYQDCVVMTDRFFICRAGFGRTDNWANAEFFSRVWYKEQPVRMTLHPSDGDPGDETNAAYDCDLLDASSRWEAFEADLDASLSGPDCSLNFCSRTPPSLARTPFVMQDPPAPIVDIDW
jgi:hypothetical protein